MESILDLVLHDIGAISFFLDILVNKPEETRGQGPKLESSG
jgi:hypothetical protein